MHLTGYTWLPEALATTTDMCNLSTTIWSMILCSLSIYSCLISELFQKLSQSHSINVLPFTLSTFDTMQPHEAPCSGIKETTQF